MTARGLGIFGAALLPALLAGCASHPRGTCGPACTEIESATHILEYPTQRLRIYKRLARQPELSQHEQTYLVNAIFVGGFSHDVADALEYLIANPVCTAQTCAEIREKLKTSRLLGRAERRVVEALNGAYPLPEDADEEGADAPRGSPGAH
jgi:hypothetical protein